MKQSGFTLIELMLTVIVAGIVAAIALPSFTNLIARNQIASTANTVVGALNLARVEAAQRGTTVSISSISGDDDWGASGYRIWLDGDGDNAFDNGEELRVYDAIADGLTLTEVGGTSSINFNASGFSTAAISLNLCTDTPINDRQIGVTLSGRVNIIEIACP